MLPRRASVWLLVACAGCSRFCAAPSPEPAEDFADRDAAPHALEASSRCETRSQIALPGPLELGRVETSGARVLVGARRGSRAGVLEVDAPSARFVETGAAVGDAPPPLPIVSGDKILALAYEGAKPHLVLRDSASPAAPIVELPADAPDESLAYDAAARADGSIAVVWDAPAAEGSAVFATVVRNGSALPPVRLSPEGVDADVPRVVALGPTVVAMWIAHRAIPRPDAAAPLEGPGQDLDHAWIEMLPFDDTLHSTAPLRHLTPEAGRIQEYDAAVENGMPPTISVVARDAIELGAGQGGSALLVRASAGPGIQRAGPEIPPPTVLAEHVGGGLPLLAGGFTLYDDATDRGRASQGGVVSPEPALDAARPLASLPGGDVLVAPESTGPKGAELSVVRCRAGGGDR
jgi:hypothetical protein